jgi:hypothetical protein
MRHGSAERQATPHDPHPEPTDGLGVRLVGARLELVARIAAELHAQEVCDAGRRVGRAAREPRLVRHPAIGAAAAAVEAGPR